MQPPALPVHHDGFPSLRVEIKLSIRRAPPCLMIDIYAVFHRPKYGLPVAFGLREHERFARLQLQRPVAVIHAR